MNRRIETAFPALTTAGYAVTSPMDDEYNCIAWAVGEEDSWWWPDMLYIGYWPKGVVREETIEAFLAAFRTVGFEACAARNQNRALRESPCLPMFAAFQLMPPNCCLPVFGPAS